MIAYNPDTAILLILSTHSIYNTKKVIKKIREVKPDRLYVAANTPDAEVVFKVYLENINEIANIDWECDVKTLYECYTSYNHMMHEVITWFFKNETHGIVLENLYLPCTDFFGFCSSMLEKYEDDDRIAHISGMNPRTNSLKDKRNTYYFSALTDVRGWAGWRRNWRNMNVKNYARFKKNDYLNKIPSYAPFKSIWYNKFEGNINNKKSSDWSAKYSYSNILNNKLTIVPNFDLISYASYVEDKFTKIEVIKHPDFIICDYEADIEVQEIDYSMSIITKDYPDSYSYINDKLIQFSNKIKEDLRIPKIIHQIYEDPAGPPERLLRISESWKELHPDWEYRFWGKKEMNDFVETKFSDFIPIYRAYPFNVQRWDAIRYLILHTFGGMYADFDYECIEPMDVLLSGTMCCMGMEPTINALAHKKNLIVGNALMACVPGHKYFELIIKDMIENRDKIFTSYGPLQIMETTGPFMTTRVYEKLRRKNTVTLLPAGLVAPLTLKEVRLISSGQDTPAIIEKLEKAYAVHYFFGSWVAQT